MKHVPRIVLSLAICGLNMQPVYAQVPSLIRYQGTIVDTNNVPVEGTHALTFRLYAASSGGTALWTESQSTIPISRGVFSVLLGQTATLDLPFDEAYWLSTQVDSDAEMSPRQRLTSVPYAYRAELSDQAMHVAQDLLQSELKSAERFQDEKYSLTRCVIDAFKTAIGIDAAGSTGYQQRGNPDYDVVTGVVEPVILEVTPESTGKGVGLMNDYYQYAQQFRLSSAQSVSAASFYLKGMDGAPGNMIVRILTDAGGVPSGNLVTANAIITGITPGSSIRKVAFPQAVPLAANTPYWLAFSLETPANPPSWNWYTLSAGEQSGGGPYSGGVLAYKINASGWNIDANADLWFRLHSQTQVSSATVVSQPTTIPAATQQVLVNWVETSSTPIVVSVSRDNGVTWTAVTKGEWVSLAQQPAGTQLRMKAVIASDAQLEAWGAAW